ncbi:hypothetical protein B0H17DRAFT_1130385 [Mycena rosella]|uniref:Uncharacterized protein n=1 Tax=Mycena rosella TaxID=1033263 RepID=A0AAD7DRK3_MYCRO|nr:hypothetical protein B0H17DRAFT_1130385 [Mycena rosella]
MKYSQRSISPRPENFRNLVHAEVGSRSVAAEQKRGNTYPQEEHPLFILFTWQKNKKRHTLGPGIHVMNVLVVGTWEKPPSDAFQQGRSTSDSHTREPRNPAFEMLEETMRNLLLEDILHSRGALIIPHKIRRSEERQRIADVPAGKERGNEHPDCAFIHDVWTIKKVKHLSQLNAHCLLSTSFKRESTWTKAVFFLCLPQGFTLSPETSNLGCVARGLWSSVKAGNDAHKCALRRIDWSFKFETALTTCQSCSPPGQPLLMTVLRTKLPQAPAVLRRSKMQCRNMQILSSSSIPQYLNSFKFSNVATPQLIQCRNTSNHSRFRASSFKLSKLKLHSRTPLYDAARMLMRAALSLPSIYRPCLRSQ